MNKDFNVCLTINFEDGREIELEGAGHVPPEKVWELVMFMLDANGIKEWSSLVVSIVPPEKARKPKPVLKVVK